MQTSDVNSVNGVYVSGFDRSPNEDYNKIVLDKNYLCFVAEVDNTIVGYINLLVVDSVAEIINLAVLKNYQKNGVGTKLIEFCIQYLKEKAFIGMMLEVNDQNLPAIKLYEKTGFKKIYVREKYYEGKNDAIIMKLDF